MGVHTSTAKESRLIRVLPSMRLVDPFDLKPEDICIKDIAHHLARICRWNGGVNGFYSVAEHSIKVAASVAPQFRLWGLLHDAAETYIGDITRPVKNRLWVDQKPIQDGAPKIHESIKMKEWRILYAIAEKYGLDLTGDHWEVIPPQVLDADEAQLARENSLIKKGRLNGNYPNIAEARFLAVFNKLMEDRK
ncbi:MAG: hypothetical protein ABJI69_10005 [Balneola sp.]